jgi:hypothetical protein
MRSPARSPPSLGTSSSRASTGTTSASSGRAVTSCELLYVPLPWVPDELPADPVNRDMHRCAKVSGGRPRHVQIHGNPDAPVVTMWAAGRSPTRHRQGTGSMSAPCLWLMYGPTRATWTPMLHRYSKRGDVSVSDTRRIRGYGYSNTPF